ncbi:MAG: PEPxxWA-CTERM sorting domain-containing protein [Pseudomonadota bacterium]|uniref:PEPxxWA-CTERM sorting domain-containing protein n=1 Tax=Phenylobacterium sp. TaxID=1871053 RepID=UPI0025CD15E1|nr:PEPxxWA-CTERM sorting domain-containing protein [Phenylobacterium sp.]
MRKVLLASAMALAVSTFAGAADAAVNILYRVDHTNGVDYVAQALNNGAYNVTTTSGDLSGYNLSFYDIVVYLNQDSNVPGGDVGRLDSYINSGGKLIFNTWQAGHPSLGGDYGGKNNNDTLNVGAVFDAGIGSPLSITKAGEWDTFSSSLIPTSATIAATYSDGTAAILLGNGGRTIWNGFLNDSVASSQLYGNQLSYLAGAISAVPEPATWAMMITGFGLAGSALRRRRDGLALAA